MTASEARASIEDDFMKLDEMEAFLEAAENQEMGGDDDLDEGGVKNLGMSDSDIDDDALEGNGSDGHDVEEYDDEEADLEALLDNAAKIVGRKKADKRKRVSCEFCIPSPGLHRPHPSPCRLQPSAVGHCIALLNGLHIRVILSSMLILYNNSQLLVWMTIMRVMAMKMVLTMHWAMLSTKTSLVPGKYQIQHPLEGTHRWRLKSRL